MGPEVNEVGNGTDGPPFPIAPRRVRVAGGDWRKGGRYMSLTEAIQFVIGA